MLKMGDEVEYTEYGKGGDLCIRGWIVEIQEGAELLDLDTGTRRPAVRFVIRDRCGTDHTTQAMAVASRRDESPRSRRSRRRK